MFTPRPNARRRCRAFTGLELVVLVAVLMTVYLVFMRKKKGGQAQARRLECVNQLKGLGQTMGTWSADHRGHYPLHTSTNLGGTAEFVGQNAIAWHIHAWSNWVVSPITLACPGDNRPPATSLTSLTDDSISYFFNADADPANPRLIMAADRNITTNTAALVPGWRDMRSGEVIRWTASIHKLQGNAAMGDGSVHAWTQYRVGNPPEHWGIP
ncbi:MAG TPA: hypothetical protein VHH73_16630 [Verrucomicrobiae bacterium]|nr:hypothetical protein [Verrucomicrobiae bacterium]